jgi:membrane-bound lytic murein transglycosylase B
VVLILLGATTFAMAAENEQPSSANTAAQNSPQQQLSSQGGMNLTSDQVRQVQQKLDESGFRAGRADGVLGRETQEALRDFQKQKGLQQTGRPDNETLSALGVNGSEMQNVGQQNGGSDPNQSAANSPAASTGNSMSNPNALESKEPAIK